MASRGAPVDTCSTGSVGAFRQGAPRSSFLGAKTLRNALYFGLQEAPACLSGRAYRCTDLEMTRLLPRGPMRWVARQPRRLRSEASGRRWKVSRA